MEFTHRTFQVCCSLTACPRGRPLLTHASTGDTQTLKGRFGSVSCEFPGSSCAQGFVWALRASLVGIGFDSKHDFIPPTVYWDFSFVPGCWYLFWWDPTFSCWWLFSSYLQFGGFHRKRWVHVLLLCHILGLFVIYQNPFPLKKRKINKVILQYPPGDWLQYPLWIPTPKMLKSHIRWYGESALCICRFRTHG